MIWRALCIQYSWITYLQTNQIQDFLKEEKSWVIVKYLIQTCRLDLFGPKNKALNMYTVKSSQKTDCMRSLILIRLIWLSNPNILVNLPYARHYKPRFVYSLPTVWRPKMFFQGGFVRKFYLYAWLVFKSGL